MLGTIKLYLAGALAAIFAYLAIKVKFLSQKNEKLQHDAKINDEIKSIHEQQEEDEIEVLENERVEIEKEIEPLDRLDRHDRFTRL